MWEIKIKERFSVQEARDLVGSVRSILKPVVAFFQPFKVNADKTMKISPQ